MKFWCLGDDETVRGFRLVGIQGQVVSTPAETAAALEQAASRLDCAVVLMTERVAETARQQVEAFRSARERPLLVEIPGPDGPLAGRKSLTQLLQEAVGIRVG